MCYIMMLFHNSTTIKEDRNIIFLKFFDSYGFIMKETHENQIILKLVSLGSPYWSAQNYTKPQLADQV